MNKKQAKKSEEMIDPEALLNLMDDLNREKKKYQRLSEEINDLLVELNPDGKCLFANQAHERILGIKPEKIIGKNIFEIIHPDDQSNAKRVLKKALQTGSAKTELRVKKADGTYRYFEAKGHFDTDRKRALIISRDITERKKEEQRLKKLQARLQKAMEAGNIAWWEMELPSGKIEFSPRKAKMLGYLPEKFETYEDFTELIHPEDYEKTMKAMRDHLDSKKERYQVEYRIKMRNGNYSWFRDVGEITKQEGDYKKVTGMVVEIDSRKRAELGMERARRRIQQIFNNVNDALFLHKINEEDKKPGKFLRVNDVACERLGYTKEEFLKMSPSDIDSEETKEKLNEIIEQLLEEKEATFQGEHITKEGKKIPVELSAHLFEMGGEKRIITAARDITERKKREETIKSLAEITAGAGGQDFFDALTESLCDWFGLDVAFVGKITGKKAFALSMIIEGEKIDDFEYELPGTPCEEVTEQGACLYRDSITEEFSESKSLQELEAEGYIGAPILDRTGEIKGVIWGVSKNKIEDVPTNWKEVLEIIASKALVEMREQEIMDELEKQRQSFNNIVEKHREGILIVNDAGEIQFANKAAEEIFQRKKRELEGTNFSVPSSIPEEGFEIDIIRKNGERGVGEVRSVETHWMRQEAHLIMIWDITERKKAQQRVKESLEKQKELVSDLNKFKLAVENTTNQVVIADAKGDVIYANPATERITGYSVEEVLGTKAGSLWGGLMSAEFYQDMWQTIAQKKETFSGEIKNQRKSGRRYDANITISPVTDNQGEIVFYVSISRDITQQKEIEEMKTEFVSMASHQLQTPLTAIKLFSEMLAEQKKGLNEKQLEYLQNINESTDRMVELVNNLLNVSRLETGRLKVNPESTDLVELIKEEVKEIESLDKVSSCQINFERFSEEVTLSLDKTLIRQVIRNLLNNAVEYTEKDCRIGVDLEENENCYLIKVSDNGIGIPQAEQENIFNKFTRAENAKKKRSEGSGLGLYLVKMIMEGSGGAVWFKSEEGEGTTFYVEIPKEGMQEKEGEKDFAIT